MNKRKLVFYLGILLTAISIIGIAVYVIGTNRGKNQIEEIRETLATVSYPEGTIETVVFNPETNEEETVIIDSGLICPVDFYSLWDVNSDIYAWLRIPGTVIDYPVLQNIDDSDYYLRHDLEGNYYSAGNLYSQYYFNHDFDNDALTVIYGHNMRDDSMFGSLDLYDDETYIDEHKYLYFYTNYHSYRYRVVAVLTIDSTNLMYKYGEDQESFVDDFNSNSIGNGWVDSSFTADVSDNFLVLSTCRPYGNNRLIVVAVREDVL